MPTDIMPVVIGRRWLRMIRSGLSKLPQVVLCAQIGQGRIEAVTVRCIKYRAILRDVGKCITGSFTVLVASTVKLLQQTIRLFKT